MVFPLDNDLFRSGKRDEKLQDRKILKEQVVRLLNDDRKRGFVEGFADSWLSLITRPCCLGFLEM